MNMNYFFKIIRRHFIAFLVTFLIIVGSVVLINSILTPQYQAKASLVATISPNESGTYNELLASQMLTKTYENAIQSRFIANEAKKKLNTSETAFELLERVEVRTDPGTLVIIVSATHNNPEDAVAISNAFAESFIEKSTEIVPNAKLVVLDLANKEDASTPVSPKKWFNLAIGVFIGIFSALSVSLFLEKNRPRRSRNYPGEEMEQITE